MNKIVLLSFFVICVFYLMSCQKKEEPQKENKYTTIEVTVEKENGEKISEEYVKMFDEKTYALFQENHLTKALAESKTNKDGIAVFTLDNSKWFNNGESVELMFTVLQRIDNNNYTYSSKGGTIRKNEQTKFTIVFSRKEVTTESALVIENNILKSITDKSVTSIILPSEVKEIANNVFEESEISEIILNEGLEKIGDKCFLGSKIKKINFPSSLKHIGIAAFSDCKEIESVDMSNTKIETMSESIFLDSGIKEIIFPSNLKKISSESFAGTDNLQKVTINESIKDIDTFAFYKSGLSSIRLHNGLKQIGYMAFAYCSKLSKIEIKHDSPSNDNGTIGIGVFQNCVLLTDVELPDNITKMEGYTFIECNNLKNITLPKSLKNIGELGLRTNYNINTIVFKSENVPDFTDSEGKPVSNVLPFVENITEISVPKQSLETYKSKWTPYTKKIKGI